MLSIRDLLGPPDERRLFTSLYMITDLLDTDLHKIIQVPRASHSPRWGGGGTESFFLPLLRLVRKIPNTDP